MEMATDDEDQRQLDPPFFWRGLSCHPLLGYITLKIVLLTDWYT